jgi:hypothetical protein
MVKQLVDVIDNGRPYRLDIPKADSPGQWKLQNESAGAHWRTVMHIVLMDTDAKSVVARFDADAPPMRGDLVEAIPRGHTSELRRWEVRAIRWVLVVEEPKADESTSEEASILHVVVDVADTVRTA